MWRRKKEKTDIDYKNIPEHIGIIMDGNGRWAKKRGLPRVAGHVKGAENIRRISDFANEIGIKYLSMYAFSTENWNRPKDEVDGLLKLFRQYLLEADTRLANKTTRVKVIGDKTGFPEDIRELIKHVETINSDKDGVVVLMSLNYGGRDDIVRAVRNIAAEVKEGKLLPEDISERMISDNIDTKNIKDPELIIRPSGEKRLSNFLLWQSAYSEFWYSDVLWPDFSERDLLLAIRDYQQRDRRFGKVKG